MKSKQKKTVKRYNGQRIRHLDNGSFMADFSARGVRRRKCFRTLELAKTAIDQWNIADVNQGRAAFSLADHDRVDVGEARKWMDGATRLRDVFLFWKKHHPTGEKKTIEQLVDEFLKANGRRGTKSVTRRPATVAGHAWRLSAFQKAFGLHLAHEVTKDAIEQWLDVNGWQGINRRHYLASVKALFAFAVRNKAVAVNPAVEIETPEETSEPPAIMTVKDIGIYLRAMETVEKVTVNRSTGVEYKTTCEDLLPREAIAFFCGLRPEELSRLDWRNVSLENKLVTVSGDVAKVQGHRRHVDMSENLVRWLAPYAKDSGPVWPHESKTTLVRRRKMARDAAGVEVPDNAGRHAFASYHLAMHENAALTSERLGHADTKLLKQVYRNISASDGKPITKAMAEAFFSIEPQREKGVLRFRKSA